MTDLQLGISKVVFGSLVSLAYGVKYELVEAKVLLTAGFGGGIAWFTHQFAFYMGISDLISYFLASILMSIYSEIMARLMKKPVTVFLIVAMLPLVPGYSMYQTMAYSVAGETYLALTTGANTFAIAGALTMGTLTASTAISFFNKVRKTTQTFWH